MRQTFHADCIGIGGIPLILFIAYSQRTPMGSELEHITSLHCSIVLLSLAQFLEFAESRADFEAKYIGEGLKLIPDVVPPEFEAYLSARCYLVRSTGNNSTTWTKSERASNSSADGG
jgi:hypothetical protein